MTSDKKIADITKELIEDENPGAWIGFLFDIQNSLIANGLTSSLTDNGCHELSGRFAELKNFFQELHNMNKSN